MKELQEGDKCLHSDCLGLMLYSLSENCSCHISPPCSSCTNVRLTCNECGWELNDKPGTEIKGELRAEKLNHVEVGTKDTTAPDGLR